MKTNTTRLIAFSLLLAASTNMLKAQATYEETVEQALTAVNAGEIDKAEKLFMQALKLHPSDIRNALIYYNVATLDLQRGDKKRAIGHLSTAIGITPHNIPILRTRADLYLQIGNQGKAILD